MLLSARPKKRRSPSAGWITGSRMISANPLGFFLPYMIGPRWNCHALTATSSPLFVRGSLQIDPGPLAGAASWTLVVYDDRFRAAATLSGDTTPRRRAVDVPPGSYTLFLRFYGADGAFAAPEVFVDGELRLAGCAFGEEGPRYRDFLATINDKDALPYRLLQYHAFYAVRRMQWLPEAWVRGAFLPVGNPETKFLFGPLRTGQRLRIRTRPSLREAALVFACLYNESSFPMAWTEIAAEEGTLGPAARDGAYLVRVVPRRDDGVAEPELGTDLSILIEQAE